MCLVCVNSHRGLNEKKTTNIQISNEQISINATTDRHRRHMLADKIYFLNF